MIRSEKEYQEALEQLARDKEFAERQRAALVDLGLPPEAVERGMGPLLSFQAQLEDEVGWYERARRGDLGTVSRLPQIGRLLIGARIAQGLTQRELAERLGVSEAQVSRDERNEYHGLSLERAQRVLDALGVSMDVGIRVRTPTLA
jgi:DNA-binding XRE family transcriptional regulator